MFNKGEELMKKTNIRFIIIIMFLSIVPIIILGYFGINPFKDRTTSVFSLIIFSIYLVTIVWMVGFKAYNINKDLDNILINIGEEIYFKDINRIISSTNISEEFKNIFEEYRKSLRPIKGGLNQKENPGSYETKYYATTKAEMYFNEQTLMFDKLHIKTINFIPQVLTGLGIFGTFLGIVQGVSGLGEEMSSDQIQLAISKLLEGVNVSFTTSLYGILFSLTLTLITKIIFDNISMKIDLVNGIFDKSLNNNIEEEGLKEIEVELKRQTASLEKLATDISEDLGARIGLSLEENMNGFNRNIEVLIEEIRKSFEGSMINQLKPSLDKLSLATEKLGNFQQNSTDKFIEESISKIEKVLSAGTENEMEKLRHGMEITNEKNNELISKFTESIESIKELFSSQEQLVNETNDSAKNVNLTTKNIMDLQNGIGALVSNIEETNKSSSKSIDEIEKMYQKLSDSVSKQGDVSLKLDEMINKSYEYSKLQDSYVEKLFESTNIIDGNIKNSKEFISEITKNIKEYSSEFEKIQAVSFNIAEKLNSTYMDALTGIENSSKILNSSISKVDKDILSNVSKLGNEMSDISNELSGFCVALDKFAEKFENFSNVEESTQKIWLDYNDSFNSLNENINTGIIKYTEQINKGTYDVFKNYDEKIAEAVTKLQSMVQGLNDELEDIGDIFLEMLDKVDSAV